MEDGTTLLWKLLAILLLVAGNAFFVATEFALVGVRKSKVEALAKEGAPAAKQLLRAVQNLDRYIAGTQVGITLASLALGWIGEEALHSVFEQLFSFLPKQVIDWGVPTLVAFMVITFLHVVLGELVPKSVALQYTEKTALWVARPSHIAVVLMSPLIWALNSTGNLILRLLGLRSSGGHEGMVHSVEELKILVEDSHKQGVLDEMERFMLHRVFNMKHLVARQVMVHRLDIVGMPVEMPYEGLMLAVVDAPYSRFPVYESDIDHVVGMLFVKDLIGYRRTAQSGPFDLRKIIRPGLFVPETVAVETLLAQFKKARTQIAIVLDEFGGTSGLVTLEDVIEELLGDMQDTAIQDEQMGRTEAMSEPILVDGRTRLDVLNERYGLTLRDEEVDTIAGLVTSRLGRVPASGEEVTVENLLIKVLETEGHRITTLSIEQAESGSDDDGPSQESGS